MIVVAFNMIGTSAIGFLAAMTTFFSKIDHELEYGNSFLLWNFSQLEALS